jgi:hypothetical protein
MTEMKKKTNAGVHNDRIRVTTSITIGGVGCVYMYMYTVIEVYTIYILFMPSIYVSKYKTRERKLK